MFFGFGLIVVFLSVLGGYAALGGNLYVLWQPFEYVIIVGSAIGAYIIASPRVVLARTGSALKQIIRGSSLTKAQFTELLCLQYAVFKLANRSGMLALEKHVEHPEQSNLFAYFPGVMHQQEALRFMCDYLRLMTLGGEDAYQMDTLMELELDVQQNESAKQVNALRNMGEALPALGIVAAVLGIIKTMGALDAPPEVLGHSIGGALVGTFVGIFISYGIVSPMANALGGVHEDEIEYYTCIKTGLTSYLNGNAPTVCLEFARKSIQSHLRPDFYEIEAALAALPALE